MRAGSDRSFTAPLAVVVGVVGLVCLVFGLALSWTELVAGGLTMLAFLALCFLTLIGVPVPDVSIELPRPRDSASAAFNALKRDL